MGAGCRDAKTNSGESILERSVRKDCFQGAGVVEGEDVVAIVRVAWWLRADRRGRILEEAIVTVFLCTRGRIEGEEGEEEVVDGRYWYFDLELSWS